MNSYFNIYWAEIQWYNDYDGIDQTDTTVILAHNMEQAAQIIEKNFDYISKVTIESIAEGTQGTIIYLPNDCEHIKEMISDANNY